MIWIFILYGIYEMSCVFLYPWAFDEGKRLRDTKHTSFIERKGKRSDTAIWQIPLNDWQCIYVKWHKDATNTFDYACTTITDRLRTVSWSNNSHPTGVVNLRFKGPTFPLPLMAVQSKGQTFKNLWINLHIETKDH